MEALPLFDALQDKWTQQADAWIEQNPQAFDLFCSVALHYHYRGQKIGSKAIIEEIRYKLLGQLDPTHPTGKYVFNNNYTSQIARRAIEKHPQLKWTLKIRKRKGGK